MREQTEKGFAVQAPDLAITTYGETIEAAKRAAGEAIRSNLEAYREAGGARSPRDERAAMRWARFLECVTVRVERHQAKNGSARRYE
jgi:predicted RNase H-like HicB family nuclease